MRSVFLRGKSIFLSPLSKMHDLSTYETWLNDQETTLFMGSGKFPVTIGELKSYIDAYNKSKDGILLGIFVKKSSRHIGNITLLSIDWRNRHAEVGIIIGDKEARGKGYAAEAIRLVVAHAFDRLNLHKLYAGMIEGNDASRFAFKKVGFKEEAVLKEHFYHKGRYLDCYRLGLIAGRWPR